MFYPEFSEVQDNCILGICPSNSWQSTKDRVLAQFETNGVKFILIATTTLCMAVNLPYIVTFVTLLTRDTHVPFLTNIKRLEGQDEMGRSPMSLSFTMDSKLDTVNKR